MSLYDKASLALIPSGTKASKLYSVLPANGNGDFTHTRGSTATRVNKDGLIESVAANVPRLDYPLIDGVVQSCPALLLEPSRTNEQIYSEQFDNTAWSKFNSSITANAGVAPDGNTTADKLIANTSNNKHYVQDGQGSLTGVYRASVFAKADGYDYMEIGERATGGARAVFNLSTGEIETEVLSPNARMEYYGNGWYRCSIEENMPSSNFFAFRISVSDNTTSDSSWTGNGTDGILIWGAQLELGDYPTSYIPTTSATVTRSFDDCIGAGTSAEFNDSEGVLFLETSMLSSNPNDSTFQIDDGTSTNRVRIRFTTTTNQINGLLYSGVGGQPQLNYTVNDVTNQNKVAIRYQVGQIDLFFNGFEVSTATGIASPTGFDNLSLGTEGNVKQLMTFNQALTDSELEQITSWTSFGEMAKGQLYTIE